MKIELVSNKTFLESYIKQYCAIFSEFISNNADTFRELLLNNTTKWDLLEFISKETDILRELLRITMAFFKVFGNQGFF